MAKDNRHNQDAITEAGAIPPLVAMLTAPAPEMQANAAGALANLAHRIRRTRARSHGPARSRPAVHAWCKRGTPERDQGSRCGRSRSGRSRRTTRATRTRSQSWEASTRCWACSSRAPPTRSQEYVAGRARGSGVKAQRQSAGHRQAAGGPARARPARSTTNGPRAERVLMTCASFTSDSAANQTAIAKLGGIPNLARMAGQGSRSPI